MNSKTETGESAKYRVGVVGAAGFAGAELVRLLLDHPNFKLTCITSSAEAGKPISVMYPAFTGKTELVFQPHENDDLYACDAVFLAVPHTGAMAVVPGLLEKGISVFDLSADYRLDDEAVYEQYYATKHTSPDLLAQAVFGIPELYQKDFEKAAEQYAAGQSILVSCAGCYPTATSLAAYPIISERNPQAPIVVDAISGVTGAGKTPNERTHFCAANENTEAYAVATHRHTPEIEQILGVKDAVLFTPHLAPLNRGLLSTVSIPLATPHSSDEVYSRYQTFYEKSPFVEVLPQGVMPRTDAVAGTNKAHVGVAVDERVGAVIAVAAIDNLCKGASGQAIQCANLIMGLPEDAGLTACGLPV